jgi:hypothetical protein
MEPTAARVRPMLVRVRFLPLAGVLVVAALSACDATTAVSSPEDNSNGGPDVVRSMFEARYTLPDCGELDLSPRPEGTASPDDAGVPCLRAGLESGHGGELKVTFPTIEGDPIVDYVRVLPTRQRENAVEIFQDASADEFGDVESGGWTHTVCPGRRSLSQLQRGHPVGC